MEICGFKITLTHKNFYAELQYICTKSLDYDQEGFFSGRVYSFLNVIGHACAAALRPLVYLAQTIAHLFLALYHVCTDHNNVAKECLEQAGNTFLCVLVSPFGQLYKMVQAVGGICDPTCYWR